MPVCARPHPAVRLALSLALGSVALPLRAQAPTELEAFLDYRVDPALRDCPSREALMAAIEKQLGYDPFAAAAKPHRLRAAIGRMGSGTEARVEWVDEQGTSEGERRLTSDSADCGEIARGLSFAIAVQIQLRATAEAPPLPAAVPPAPVRTETAPAVRSRTPPPPSRRIVMVGAGVVLEHGLTPDVGAGLRIFGSLGNELFSGEVSLQATLPTERRTSPEALPSKLVAQPSFTSRTLSARLAPCVNLAMAGFCAVAMVGQLQVQGAGVDRALSPSSFVAGVGGRLQLLWPAFPNLGAVLRLEALVNVTPRTVSLNHEVVWSTAPVILSGNIDLAAIFR